MIDLGMHGVQKPKEKIVTVTEYVEYVAKSATQKYDEADKLATSIDTLKQMRIAKLSEECTAAVYAGFVSPSTGYGFGFNDFDQTNFNQQYLIVVSGDNNGAPIPWKTKTQGVAEFSESQFRAVVMEAKDHKVAQQVKFWTLEQRIKAADTRKKIDAVIWE